MLKVGNWMGVFCTAGDLSGELELAHEHCFGSAADGLTQSVLVVQQHLHSASVSSHNHPLIQLPECGQGQNHLTVTSPDSATGKWGCGKPVI